MDAKKKRNKKKKGNQGKNNNDVASNAGEAAPQNNNHELDPHDKVADADDAMSSVGEVVLQDQPTPQIDHTSTNGHDTESSVGEGIPCYKNNEPTITQENHNVSNTVHADQRSIGMSESSVELDIHKLNDSKLDKIHEAINHLEDEKSLWLQKVSILESELEKLHNKVGYQSQNEVLLEEKLNSLQNGYDLLVKKEEVLDTKVKCIEDINGTVTYHEASLKERLSGLEETNKALQLQVKVLEETSNNTTEENQRLTKSLNELDSRVQALEATAALSEASTEKGSEMIFDRGLNNSVTFVSDNNYSQISNSPSNVYASNSHIKEAPIQLQEKVSSNNTARGFIDVNEHQFEPRMTEEIVPVPLDDIQIREDDAQQSGADDETVELPFSDAPIIGAPFRLISFVARYVSGADLVDEK